jgi:cell division ATPase FtsA
MMHGTIADMRGVSLSIERSLIQASQKVETIPKDVILAFSSSQFIADQITTQYIRKAGNPIGMHEVDTMVKKVEKDSFDRVRTRARTSFGIVHDDLKLVSSTITGIEIDGKSVSNPIGFTGTKVRLSILNLFAPASEFNVVRSVASHIGKNIISLIPTPLVFPKLLEKTNYVDT